MRQEYSQFDHSSLRKVTWSYYDCLARDRLLSQGINRIKLLDTNNGNPPFIPPPHNHRIMSVQTCHLCGISFLFT